MIKFSVDELLETLVAEKEAPTIYSQLIVLNDDFNTFDWVIQSLMEVCSHTYEQSEQLSLIVHFKGKACVMTDGFDALKANERCSYRKRYQCCYRDISKRIILLH